LGGKPQTKDGVWGDTTKTGSRGIKRKRGLSSERNHTPGPLILRTRMWGWPGKKDRTKERDQKRERGRGGTGGRRENGHKRRKILGGA